MKVIAVLTTTDVAEPAGQTYAHTTMTLTDAAGGIQTAAVGTITMPDGTSAEGAEFTVTAPGAGSVVAQAVDSNGQPMGSAASGSFSVATTFRQPASVVVTLA